LKKWCIAGLNLYRPGHYLLLCLTCQGSTPFDVTGTSVVFV
jgi:hypothetical protein